MAGNARGPGRSVISKVSAILLAISEGSGHTLTEIAGRAELPLSTVHRLATELAAWCVLERGGDGRYRVGAALAPARGSGPVAAEPVGDRRGLTIEGIRDRAVPVMEDLFRATGSRVRVGLLDGTQVAYVEKSSGHLPVSRATAAARLPAHATALGKALLAFSPPRTVEAVIAQGLTSFTPHTVTRAERLRWGLRTVRATRLAICDRELDPEACGVATAVFGARGDVVAAIELRVQDPALEVPFVRAPLAVASGALARELGPPSNDRLAVLA